MQRPAEVREQLEQTQMPSEEAPDDNQVRQTYNFAPGYYGLVYRPELPDSDLKKPSEQGEGTSDASASGKDAASQDPKYKLQAMKWGKAFNAHVHNTSLYQQAQTNLIGSFRRCGFVHDFGAKEPLLITL